MRMIFFRFLIVPVLCLAFFGCGEAPNEGAQNSGEVIRLNDARRGSDGRWTYSFEVNSLAIFGFRHAPFVTGQFNNWKETRIADADHDDWYEVEITTFNQEVGFTYGGDLATKSFADIKGSQYYDAAEDRLVIGFRDGLIHKKGVAVFPLPAEVSAAPGDDYVRIKTSYPFLIIYFNNTKVFGSTNLPFHMGDYGFWIPERQEIIDSSGWGKAVIWNTALPRFIRFTYGGDSTSALQDNWSWPVVTNSVFFDKRAKVFNIAIGNSGVLSPGF